ncbi:MAG: hypothetical protein A2V59_03940 [Armatimonadetes bacterium RBG_19FT_COMBO_69_19]|nr:MAG: hypothetical protein A2V59_03940 [Armatimonadetes bacterium RBG_19FT_COMBO_69_19]
MRKATTTVIILVTMALVAALAAPALAETITYTTSFVNRLGNTITVETTYVDGVLTSQVMREVQPDGFLKMLKTWEYYPNGMVKTSEEWRYSATSPTHITRQYSDTGVLLSQVAELYLNGELAVKSIITYDSTGLLLTQEDRILTTLADGTQVWVVTVSTYAGGVLVSSITKEYPYGYNFDAPTEASLEERPGWGHGDTNHDHTGPGGKENKHDGGNGGAAAGGNEAIRPGNGYGDDNHQHTGSGQK